jgi:hypothetical protein
MLDVGIALVIGYLLGRDKGEDRPLPLPPLPKFHPIPTVPTSYPAPSVPSAPSSPPAHTIPAVWPTAAAPYGQGGPPPFPGPGWEPAQPPSVAVVNRARQLQGQLALGQYTTENTAGDWITYQGAMTSGGKGVVAFRVKPAFAKASPPMAPPPSSFATAPSMPRDLRRA